MKKLLTLLLLATLFIGCSSDDDDIKQDYTSFVFYTNESDITFPNSVAGYKKDGKYYKLGDLGNISKDQKSKELTLTDNSITEVYFFFDYDDGVTKARMLDDIYKLKRNQKNNIEIIKGTKGISIRDKTDPTQYPQ